MSARAAVKTVPLETGEPPVSGGKGQYNVAAVQEALALLMLVSAKPGLGVTDLARLTGNTKARSYRLLATLENAGFVRRLPGALTYQLGYSAFTLALAAHRQVDLAQIAQAHLAALGARVNEDLQLLLRDGLESVVVAVWDCTHELRIFHKVGMRRPLNAGASGKVLLAWSEPELVAALFSDSLQRFTKHTLIDPTKLNAQLEVIRTTGYAVSSSEVTQDVVAIAAPVRDATGHVIASLSVSLPASRAPHPMDPLVAEVCAQAAELSRDLGAVS